MRQRYLCSQSGFGGGAIVAILTAALAQNAAAQCDAWQPLGAGMDDRVFALTVYNGEVIAGGAFFSPGGAMGHIARWNGTIWQPLGTGIDSAVLALTVYNGELIAAGAFGFPGGVPAEHIARWNSTDGWRSLGAGLSGGIVNAVSVFNGELIAAGEFTNSGGVSMSRVARWNGSEWRPLGLGLNWTVNALTVFHGELIAGGDFWMSGTDPMYSLARWNGATWQQVGYGTNGGVTSLAAAGGGLYVGGTFTIVSAPSGAVSAPLIARWDGSAWTALGAGLDGVPLALISYGGGLIAAGDFTMSGASSVNHIAQWDGSRWRRLSSGLDDRTTALTVYNGTLIAGGTFLNGGGASANHIARWQQCDRCAGDVGGDDTVDVDDLLSIVNAWGPCLPPPALCEADTNGDDFVNVDDLLTVIGAWGPCPTGACWLPTNACAVNTQAECGAALGLGWVRGATCIDTDGDRIPDAFEKNDCSEPSLPFVGTDPAVADTDEDQLSDGDEFLGTTAGLNLPAMGANPLRKNILIEADWVQHPGNPANKNRPHTNQVDRVMVAFSSSTVTNHCWGTGVTVLVDYGQGGLFTGGNQLADPNGNGMINVLNDTLDGSEFAAIKGNVANFAVNRNGYFHYCLTMDAYSIAGTYQNSSGLAELPGDDFMVAFGQWSSGDDDKIGNTIMHELGHNLDLRHGGYEDRNLKPNYNSIMNYWYQMCGLDADNDAYPDGGLDYSRGSHLGYALDEDALNEPAGVTGSGPGIDWDGVGGAVTVGLHQNINCRVLDTFANSACLAFVMQNEACSTMGACFDSTCDTLRDFNDWLAVVYSGITDADFGPREIMHCWLDDTASRRIEAAKRGQNRR